MSSDCGYIDMTTERSRIELLNLQSQEVRFRNAPDLNDDTTDHEYEVIIDDGEPSGKVQKLPSKDKLSTTIKLLKIVLCTVLIVGAILAIFVLMATHYKREETETIEAATSTTETFVTQSGKAPDNCKSMTTKMEQRRECIKSMFLEAWIAYKQHAWGDEELNAYAKSSSSSYIGNSSGLTIVTAMSTMWVMELKEEFSAGQKWIRENLDLSKIDYNASVYYIIVNYIGGLLSCYALTREQMFLQQALKVAKLVEPAFDNTTRRVGGFQLDYLYLSDVSEDTSFRRKIDKIRQTLSDAAQPDNLYREAIYVNGTWSTSKISLFHETNHFYLSLINSFIQSNQQDVRAIEMYKQAMDAAEGARLFYYSQNRFLFTRNYNTQTNIHSDYMDDSSCIFGAILALGANSMEQALSRNAASLNHTAKRTERYRIALHRDMAEQLIETCHLEANQTKTGLIPKEFYFNFTSKTAYSYQSREYYIAQSYFVLWRLTHNAKYREYAWQMTQAIHTNCRYNNGGYSSIVDVNQVPASKYANQDPVFLSATLKYLYLTFSDDSVLPLDQWVFNSVGHPLPVCGKHDWYPEKKCRG